MASTSVSISERSRERGEKAGGSFNLDNLANPKRRPKRLHDDDGDDVYWKRSRCAVANGFFNVTTPTHPGPYVLARSRIAQGEEAKGGTRYRMTLLLCYGAISHGSSLMTVHLPVLLLGQAESGAFTTSTSTNLLIG